MKDFESKTFSISASKVNYVHLMAEWLLSTAIHQLITSLADIVIFNALYIIFSLRDMWCVISTMIFFNEITKATLMMSKSSI